MKFYYQGIVISSCALVSALICLARICRCAHMSCALMWLRSYRRYYVGALLSCAHLMGYYHYYHYHYCTLLF